MTYDNSAALTPVSQDARKALGMTSDVMLSLEIEFDEFLSNYGDPEVQSARLARHEQILSKAEDPDPDTSAPVLLGTYAYDLLSEAERLQQFAYLALKWLDDNYPQCAEIENDEATERVGDIISAEGAPQHDFFKFIPVGAKVDSITIKFAESGNPGQ